MDKYCFVKIESEFVEAEFVGVFQYSNVLNPSPMVGGHSGGVIAYPKAVIKLDGKLQEFKLSDITFQK